MVVFVGFSVVDWVVLFSEDILECLISWLLFDVLVKGGDYKVEEIVGGKVVMDNGGLVEVFYFEEGVFIIGIIDIIVKW